MTDALAAALATIRAQTEAAPRVGIVIGSGLGRIVDGMEQAAVIPYQKLPGFPHTSVKGHAGNLALGRLAGVEVAVLNGRAHYYETGRADGMDVPLHALQALGCEILVVTNAAGSLRPECGPGCLALITDHINIGAPNPLIGRSDNSRYVDMSHAYDPGLRAQMMQAAEQRNLVLHEGVYMWFSGPSFETPAEIHAARTLGADVIGMSTTPDVILARHCGLRVVAISAIVNLAAGMESEQLNHDNTLYYAEHAARDLQGLLTDFLSGLN